MVFFLSALWWRRIRGLWKLPAGRGWRRGKCMYICIYIKCIYTHLYLEKEMATHSSVLDWEFPWKRSLVTFSPLYCEELNMTEPLTHTHTLTYTHTYTHTHKHTHIHMHTHTHTPHTHTHTYIHIHAHTYIHTHAHTTPKKEQNLAVCNNMVRPREYYSWWNVRQRKANREWCHLYVESKKYTNKYTWKTEADHRHRERTSGSQRKQGREVGKLGIWG